MSKRTLPDELRSVLLAHSLDAPDPDRTVAQVLASTVTAGSNPAAVADSSQPIPLAARRRWVPSGQLLGAAAVIALVVLAAAGISRLGSGSRSNTSAGNSAKQADGTTSQSPLVNGPERPNAAQAPGFAANPPAPDDVGCSSIPHGLVVVGAHTSFQLTATGQTLWAYEYYCRGDNGQRGASVVEVFSVREGKLSYLSTLVPASAGVHVEFISSIPNGVIGQGTDNSAGARPGDLVSVRYTTDNGGRSFISTGGTIAKACQRADLTARVSTAEGGVTGQHQVLQLTNHTVNPCALEGFPKLTSTLDGRPVGSLQPSLYGPAGGVTTARVAPIVNLIPGGTAGAIIEYSSARPTCAPGNAVSVTLPSGVPLGSVPAAMSACGLFVHPLVDNPNGMG